MTIAVDTGGSKEYQHFIYKTFKRITAQHSRDTFIFISDKPLDPSCIFSENVIPVIVKKTRIFFLHQIKITSVLKKYKADVLVTDKTIHTKVSQCLIADTKTLIKYFKRATIIIAHSQFFKKEIAEKYKIDEKRIDAIYKGTDESFHRIKIAEREKIKDQYANGNEYFLTVIDSPKKHILNLLKAFSVFKKMQKSNMQLLIASHTEISKELSEALQLYRFKNEVKLLKNLNKEDLVPLTASAYAFFYTFEETPYQDLLEVMRCGAPVIAIKDEELQEVCGDAVLYINAADHNDIAEKMMLIYKDENLRQQLLEKGGKQIKKYNWDNSAELLWRSIQKAVN